MYYIYNISSFEYMLFEYNILFYIIIKIDKFDMINFKKRL